MPARRGHRDRRADTRHDLHSHSRAGARENLLAAAAEHERITALETHHEASRVGVVDQDGVDGGLLEVVPTRRLAGEDPERVGRRLVDELGRRQLVVDDHLGATEPFEPAQRDQLRVAGAGADQDDAPVRHRAAP